MGFPFAALQERVREHRGVRDRAIHALRENLQQDQSVTQALSNFLSPIEPTFRIRSVKLVRLLF